MGGAESSYLYTSPFRVGSRPAIKLARTDCEWSQLRCQTSKAVMTRDEFKSSTVHIFADGTYHPQRGQGYGFVVFDSTQKAILHQESRAISNQSYRRSTNCAAELIGAIRAVLWAERNGYRYVHLHADYSGVKTLSRHKRPGHRHPLFQFFKEFITRRMGYHGDNRMMVFLYHVKGHSGNLGNEIADRLARASIMHHKQNSWLGMLQRWSGVARQSLPCIIAEAAITHHFAPRGVFA